MSELRDIVTYALPSTVFIFASAVVLLLFAAAVMWPRNRTHNRSRQDKRASEREYVPTPSAIIRS
jgi:hypothetical protein